MERAGVISRRVLQELEIPPRPKLRVERAKAPCCSTTHDAKKADDSTHVFRLKWTWSLGNLYTNIAKFEIFACIQPFKSVIVTKWTKIGEIECKGHKNGGRLFWRRSANINQNDNNWTNKRAASRRIAGFAIGFRYQLTIRGVDICGRPGPYSSPVDVHV